MKIAILHEMFVKLWGAEKVVESFLEAFPDADLFTLIYDESKVWSVFPKNKISKQVFELPTQKRYNIVKKQRFCLPLMALSVEQLDFSEYDVVLCSSSWFAHWAITKPETKFIVYYHSPSWYLWHQTHEYKKMIFKNTNFFFKFILNFFLNKLLLETRIWDFQAWQRNDIRLAASKNTKKRINKYYNRECLDVLYPPVEIDKFISSSYEKSDYYLTISALTESKRLDVLISAFNKMPEKQLKIIWIGHLDNTLKNMVKWKNIEFLWYKEWEELCMLVNKSKWWIYTWVEDFWIAVIESMSAWIPVLWLKQGWFLETIIPGITWDFFIKEDWSDFIKNFIRFDDNIDKWIYKKSELLKHVEQFSKNKFINDIKKIVQN